ncbi:hypothetical protein, partial [Mesorhizobium sp. M1C.F.Ca.ET.187.01.1.1]|uniref:hypothetical protein n=1 Tax=Mesorhizobium sp. M1C.F.Ca.ET.187.01.1.1 TaxID=2563923 RepID=UPI001AED6E9B
MTNRQAAMIPPAFAAIGIPDLSGAGDAGSTAGALPAGTVSFDRVTSGAGFANCAVAGTAAGLDISNA